MSKKADKKVCGAVYFGFEVLRCQLPAGHAGNWHGKDGLCWRVPGRPYQAELRKAATLKEG